MGVCCSSDNSSSSENYSPDSPKARPRPSMMATTHTCHKSKHPQYPARAPVKEIDWKIPDPEYKPVNFTHKVVFENDYTKKDNGWADPVNPAGKNVFFFKLYIDYVFY